MELRDICRFRSIFDSGTNVLLNEKTFSAIIKIPGEFIRDQHNRHHYRLNILNVRTYLF